MNSLIKNFRFITLSCFMLLGLLTQSASGNELKYVLEFNKDSNLDDLHFTVLTDEDALVQVHNFLPEWLPALDDGQRLSMTYLSNKLQGAMIYPHPNLEQGTSEPAHGVRAQYSILNLRVPSVDSRAPIYSCEIADGVTEVLTQTPSLERVGPGGGGSWSTTFESTLLPTLTSIHRSRQAGQPDLLTEQPINRVLLTDFPSIDLTGFHAQALGSQRVSFYPYLDSVVYEGNGHYSANVLARIHYLRTIPVQIHLNNDGMLVDMTFEYNSVRFVLRLAESGTSPSATEYSLQEYEMQEIEIVLSDEEDDPSAENQTLSRGNEARQRPDLNCDEYVSPLLPAASFSSKF